MGRTSLKADGVTHLWLLIIPFERKKHGETVLHLKTMITKKRQVYRDAQGDAEKQDFGPLWILCLLSVPSMW